MTETTPINMTENAILHLKKLLEKEENAQRKVRFSVKTAGCSGLKYVVDLVEKVELTDVAHQASPDLVVYIDQKALAFIAGTQVDFVRQGLSAQFKFTNPNEKGSCGCGESFYVE